MDVANETRKSSDRLKSNSAKEKQYECNDCDETFVSALIFKKHLRRHTSATLFKCRYCTNKFSNSNALESHERGHSQKKLHPCHLCDKSYQSSNGLKRHLVWHSGIKPYECHICDMRYARSDHLRVHLRQKHKNKNPKVCHKPININFTIAHDSEGKIKEIKDKASKTVSSEFLKKSTNEPNIMNPDNVDMRNIDVPLKSVSQESVVKEEHFVIEEEVIDCARKTATDDEGPVFSNNMLEVNITEGSSEYFQYAFENDQTCAGDLSALVMNNAQNNLDNEPMDITEQDEYLKKFQETKANLKDLYNFRLNMHKKELGPQIKKLTAEKRRLSNQMKFMDEITNGTIQLGDFLQKKIEVLSYIVSKYDEDPLFDLESQSFAADTEDLVEIFDSEKKLKRVPMNKYKYLWNFGIDNLIRGELKNDLMLQWKEKEIYLQQLDKKNAEDLWKLDLQKLLAAIND